MKKIILLAILLLSVILITSCSQKNVTLNDIEKQTQEISDEGYILTSKVFVPQGTFLGKIGGEFGLHTEKIYVKKNKTRTDTIYQNYETRNYILPEENVVKTTTCNNKEKKWKCEELFSFKKIQDEETLKKLDEKIFQQLKTLPDKQIIDIASKCFEILKGSMICYHPEYLIPLYEKRGKGFTVEATSLEFVTPDEQIFILPKS